MFPLVPGNRFWYIINGMKQISTPEQMNLYLSDESRRAGTARMVLFPETTQDVIEALRADRQASVTVQGSRTGVAAGAVPDGGLVLNLSRMNRMLRLPEPGGSETVLVQPGVLLCHLRERLDRSGFFFPPDPTETTASMGGIASCNSSGARSYKYGAARNHIAGLRIVLSDGDVLTLRRGECFAKAGAFSLTTDSGRVISGMLPSVQMPDVSKHTAGYFIRQDMDMLDLFIGSEGTLGIVTEIECAVLPQPKQLWGAMIFFDVEEAAVRFVRLLRENAPDALPLDPEAIEFFGLDTLDMLRQAQTDGAVLTGMPKVPAGCAVYTEFASDRRDDLEDLCRGLGQIVTRAGGNPRQSWFAFRGPDMQRLKDFRHAAPVCVNEQISSIRKTYPNITKLGTDMSVPDSCLEKVFEIYRADLSAEGFAASLFGHIGNNHLHCNIIPRDEDEYARGKALYTRWAEHIVRMGGSVSAEHGVGKLKPWLLRKLYSEEDLRGMLRLKQLFDPQMRLSPGNIFGDQSL